MATERSTAPATLLATSASRKSQALKEKANQLYRGKRYLEAGRLYREVSSRDSLDAGARINLGLCYLKRGVKDSALEASREALRIADRSLRTDDVKAWSFPDLRARKNAYFTLDKLGGPMPVPKPGQCETWSSFSECRGKLHVCAETGNRKTGAGTLHWDILRVGLTRSRALFSYDEVEAPSTVPRLEARDMEELAIDGVPENESRWLNRDSSVVLPLGEMLETPDSACGQGCGNVERMMTECRVIHFDPCAGLVGVACATQDGEGKDRMLMGEYYLLPVK
ncbi:MAG: tetratricopeptide repeat protein [Fibrobacteria bacterium]